MVRFTIQGDQFSIRGVNKPWMKIDPVVNIQGGSKYHMTPVGSFTHPSVCVGFCQSGSQLGVKCEGQDYQRLYCDVFVFIVLRSEVAIRFVYIHRIVDNHCL